MHIDVLSLMGLAVPMAPNPEFPPTAIALGPKS